MCLNVLVSVFPPHDVGSSEGKYSDIALKSYDSLRTASQLHSCSVQKFVTTYSRFEPFILSLECLDAVWRSLHKNHRLLLKICITLILVVLSNSFKIKSYNNLCIPLQSRTNLGLKLGATYSIFELFL